MHRRDLIATTLLTLPLGAARVQAAATPPVVLELFTSQGCSSCPPADAYLGELARRPGVIALAWHVDYWNALGWRDPYAKREWTERQRSYARYLNGEVYTPALIVNGAAMVIGSDKSAVSKSIDAATPPPVAISLRRGPNGLDVEIAATATPVTGLLVTYDPERATDIGAGENQGRRLVEYRVVRDVVMLEKVATRMTLPAAPAGSGVAILLQDTSWRVVGAADSPPTTGA